MQDQRGNGIDVIVCMPAAVPVPTLGDKAKSTGRMCGCYPTCQDLHNGFSSFSSFFFPLFFLLSYFLPPPPIPVPENMKASTDIASRLLIRSLIHRDDKQRSLICHGCQDVASNCSGINPGSKKSVAIDR